MAKSKKIAIVVAAIALIAVIGVVGSTLAYFTDTDSKTNTFNMGHVDGTLLETTTDAVTGKKADQKVEGGEIQFGEKIPVVPGDELSKAPYVKVNEGSSPAYIRVKLTWDESKLEGNQKTEFDTKNPTLDINNEFWAEGEGGYYYYKDSVSAGNQTQNLFDTVTIPGVEWTNDMTHAKFGLKIDAELIQSENIKEADLAKDAKGRITAWPNAQIKQYTEQNQ